ncbi:MAG TPA: hypothetical protein VHL09_10905 [Dehalococcoidia bacterium]|nr:hypothetical protein [Dehalococcoidia bacterium]
MPGYRVTLEAGGTQYEFRTNRDGSLVLPAAGLPPASARRVTYLWPSRIPGRLAVQQQGSSADDTAFVLELAEPGGGQFRATIIGGQTPRAIDQAGGVGGQPVTVRSQPGQAYSTGAGYALYWVEDGQPLAIVSGLGLQDVVTLAEGLEEVDLPEWQQRLAVEGGSR